MICKNAACGVEVPAGQAICPRCYTIIGDIPTIGDFPAKGRRNVMWFLSESGVNGLYSGRTQNHLQPGRVEYNWHADTEAAFDEITRDRRSNFHLLISDVDRATSATSVLERFKAIHPSCAIVLIQGPNRKWAASPYGILVEAPGDFDSWLMMMHSLFRAT